MMQQKRFIGKAMRAGAPALLVLGLAFVGCNDDKATGPAKAVPSVMIMSPAKGSVTSAAGVKVSVMKSDFSYGKIGDANMDGAGHMHVYLDKPASSGTAYTTVITGGDTATVAGPIAAGSHYIIVALQKNDHSAYGIQDSVAFTVGAAASTAGVNILQPAEGATVGTSATFKLAPVNFKVVAPGDAKAGEGHFHYFVDGGAYNALADTLFTLNGLSVGDHNVRVTMQDSKHGDLNVERTIMFKVSATLASFTIASPANGDTVTAPLTVKLAKKNLTIAAPGGAVTANGGHFHYFIDNGPYNALADTAFTLATLPAGPHTIRVTMQKNDHSDFGLEQWIKVIVK